MSTLPQVEYITGSSDELGTLKRQVDAFMQEKRPAHVNLGHAFHWIPETERWEILVAITYQEQLPQQQLRPGSQLFIPKMPGVQ